MTDSDSWVERGTGYGRRLAGNLETPVTAPRWRSNEENIQNVHRKENNQATAAGVKYSLEYGAKHFFLNYYYLFDFLFTSMPERLVSLNKRRLRPHEIGRNDVRASRPWVLAAHSYSSDAAVRRRRTNAPRRFQVAGRLDVRGGAATRFKCARSPAGRY